MPSLRYGTPEVGRLGLYDALTAPSQLPRRTAGFSKRMGRGELYEYYKRTGMLEVYFALFPAG